MIEFKGTPAPWKLANGQKDMVVTDRPLGEGQIVAATYGDNMPENAMLIAAAPDLLDALLEMQRNGQKQGWNDKYESSMAKTRLAIAKALGQ